ncbi:glutamic acid-rich protein-like [Clytia hemisphaerica]|uniref:glutamic acid-rich protein-like n=1 Tax=Clytia hemisphaerica TaxID=252671 RepID=UPI0034D62980
MGRPKSNKSKSEMNKEYLKRYREKNAEKYKKGDNERKKLKLRHMKYIEPGKYKEHLAKDRHRKKEYREKKKRDEQAREQEEAQQQNDEASSSSSTPPAFRTKQSLQRSVKKVERLLPKSPRKKSEVIRGLASKYMRIQFCKKRGRKEKVLSDEQLKYLDDFFERPDITYTNPGRKDHVYLGKVNGEKLFAQKRYLLWTLREVLEILNDEKNQLKFTFRQMYKYIKTKKQIIFQGDIPDTSCLCEVCENTCLIAKALLRIKKGHPTDPHSIMEKYCCDASDMTCINSTCGECNGIKILNGWNENEKSDESEESDDSEENDDSEESENEEATSKKGGSKPTFVYKAWVRENHKIKKTTVTKETRDELFKDWETSLATLKKHIHRKREQHAAYVAMKENIEPGTAIIHVDYSESYRNKQQDEIQSAYFGQSSFSIFTACAYYKADNSDDPLVKRSLTIVSESSDHSRVASMSCVKMVIEEIEKSIALTKVIAWSDGMGAQFRSRFVFKILSEYRPDLDLEWHFNEAHHGKGPMDGIGGTIKNVVYRKVKTNKVIVNSAKEFQEAASKFVPSITSLFQTEEMLIKRARRKY